MFSLPENGKGTRAERRQHPTPTGLISRRDSSSSRSRMMKPAIWSRSAADGTTVHRYMHVRQGIADVRRGKVRYVHEPHPLKQALLEIIPRPC